MAIALKIAGIPADLKRLDQWILWRTTEEKANGRFGKQPIHKSGYPVSATDPKNWMPFERGVEL